MSTCPACGVSLPPDVKFCVECGARLAAPTLPPRDPTLPESFGGGRYVPMRRLHEDRHTRMYLRAIPRSTGMWNSSSFGVTR